MEEEQQQKKQRITSQTAALMVSTALLFDACSAIPFVGQAIAVVGSAVVFGIWFITLGIPLISPKKLVNMAFGYVPELIPAISTWPGITLGVIIMIVLTRTEDKTGIGLTKALKSGNISNAKQVIRGVRENAPRALEEFRPRVETGLRRNALPQPKTPQMNDILSPSA